MVLLLFDLLVSYIILSWMAWKQDNIFGYIVMVIYSMLCATITVTIFGSVVSPAGIVSGVPGMWVIAIFFLLGGFMAITRIYGSKNIRR